MREDDERREEKKPRCSKSEDERRVRRVQSEGRSEPLPKRRRSAQSATRRDRDRERRAGGEGAKESSTSWIWIVLILIAIAVAIWYFLLREPAEAGVVLLTFVSGSLRPPIVEGMSIDRSLGDSNQRGGVQHGDS